MTDTEAALRRVWLIRHGESESNAGLPTNGPGAAPLTALGRRQAERVAAMIPSAPSLIVSSTFVRARETALPARRRFPDVPYEEWPVQEFTYLGSLHGPNTTAEQRRPYSKSYWDRSDPALVDGGDGESFQDLITRARLMLDTLAARPERGLITVFTHGLFMRAAMWTLLTGITKPTSEQMRQFRHFIETSATPNATIAELVRGEHTPFSLLLGTATATLDEPVAPSVSGASEHARNAQEAKPAK
ncbi:histidine phosphatase family protein [Actinomadura rupiterrae]|uniref:histidine phosphatase family protein n=1 Tax=Actinomadura rupiterrae TaxID=559627 RepID=UPI0020A28211|nr:histidine phosphatase family protein [Actinomadura rupiterrae]MCP2340975.1 broad specificity phosphatase PhoE [Actinomadura rupiterrae]